MAGPRQDNIPTKPMDELKRRIDALIQKYSPTSLALIEINSNDTSAWYNLFGEDHRETAMRAFFDTIYRAQLDSDDRLYRAGRSSWDKFLLSYINAEDAEELHSLGTALKTKLDQTTIPNPKGYERQAKVWKGRTLDLDPTHLTIRVGIAYQQHGEYDISTLISKVMKTADDAKTAPGQVLAVEFNPALG